MSYPVKHLYRIGLLTLLITSVMILNLHAQNSVKIKIACIGTSITYGAYLNDRQSDSYPAQLQRMLGNRYLVENYGVSGSTMLSTGNQPYRKSKAYQLALASKPDIVLIELGTNDSKLVNRIHLNDFKSDYADLVQSFLRLPSHPRVIAMLDITSFDTDTTKIWDHVIVKQINPMIQNVAFKANIEVLDLHSLFVDQESLLPDKVHPDITGAAIIARRIYNNIIQTKDYEFDVFKELPQGTKHSSFYGYDCADFLHDGRKCKVVKPKWSAIGHPWVWRARFWGHQPQVDISLLERGFHIVFCDVAELFGNDVAIKSWNDFYLMLHKAGLSKKATLEGMSRGGVYLFNWAAVNNKKVACIYADNPVLDLKSWPAGLGKATVSKGELYQLKADYDIVNEQQLRNFHNSPIDKVKKIVKGQYPILILCADADETVPPEENTVPFELSIKNLGGKVEVYHKPGFKHHPHSLPNPTLITNFILKANGVIQ